MKSRHLLMLAAGAALSLSSCSAWLSSAPYDYNDGYYYTGGGFWGPATPPPYPGPGYVGGPPPGPGYAPGWGTPPPRPQTKPNGPTRPGGNGGGPAVNPGSSGGHNPGGNNPGGTRPNNPGGNNPGGNGSNNNGGNNGGGNNNNGFNSTTMRPNAPAQGVQKPATGSTSVSGAKPSNSSATRPNNQGRH